MLARKALLIFAVNLVGAALGLVAHYFVGHYMGPAPLGMWATALAMVGIMGVVGDFGFSFAHRKRISEHEADVGACVGTFLAIRNLGLLVMIGVAALGLAVWVGLLGKGFTDATSLPVLLVALVYQMLVLIVLVPKSTFYGMGRVAQAEMTNLVEHVVRVPLVLLAVLLFASAYGRPALMRGVLEPIAGAFGGPWDAARGGLLLAAAYTGGMLASVAAGIWIFRRHRYPVAPSDRALLRSYWSLALPFGLIAGMRTLATHFDTVMVSYFWGATDAGHYFAAQRIAILVLSMSMAVFTALFPAFSNLSSRNHGEGVRRTLHGSERHLSMVVWPVAAFLVVMAAPVMKLVFGDSFGPGAQVLQVLSLYVVVLSLARPLQALMSGTGLPGVLFVAGTLATVTNLALNLVLIPRSLLGVPLAGLKGTGAAIGTLAATLVAFAYFHRRARDLVDLRGIHAPTLRHGLAAAAAALPVWLLASGPLAELAARWYGILAAGLLLAALYALALRLLGELRREDVAAFRDVAHPGRLARYMRDEVRAEREPLEPPGPDDPRRS